MRQVPFSGRALWAQQPGLCRINGPSWGLAPEDAEPDGWRRRALCPRHELLDAIEAECTAEDIDTKRHAVRRLAVLSLQLERQGIGAAELDQYRRQIVERLSQTDRGQHPQSDD